MLLSDTLMSLVTQLKTSLLPSNTRFQYGRIRQAHEQKHGVGMFPKVGRHIRRVVVLAEVLMCITLALAFLRLPEQRLGSSTELLERFPREGDGLNATAAALAGKRFLYYDNLVDVQCPGPDGVYAVYAVSRERQPCVGLNHYVANLRTLLREARASGRVAILKPICLCAEHNGRRRIRTDWTRFVKVDGLGVEVVVPPETVRDWDVGNWVREVVGKEGRSVVLRNDERFDRLLGDEKLVIRVLPNEREFVASEWGVEKAEKAKGDGFHPRLAESIHIYNRVQSALAEMRTFGKTFVCVRARRGDKLEGEEHQLAYPCLDRCTRPGNIARVLKNNGVTANDIVYLLTDEKRDGFFDNLTRKYGFRVRRMSDVVSVASIAKLDNFFAFAVEQAMCRHARGVINTYQDNIAVLLHYDEQFKRTPIDFKGMLTPYRGECDGPSVKKADASACKEAYNEHPKCPRVCQPL